ncbi:hypothetical protein BpHYR1_039163 [Brachionus plicatilis]|uniref:Uncharacterized protein n=1 Tax=Brachionus plicatilis TaxID=10195 RepID=A0A3M7QYU4_BRAPC|nr:hypothetical protein BpHYR1_039163 [Brachionus plicatilis]
MLKNAKYPVGFTVLYIPDWFKLAFTTILVVNLAELVSSFPKILLLWCDLIFMLGDSEMIGLSL